MPIDFKLPNLGEGVDAGDVVGVSVKAGDSITRGQSMLEVETNKAVMDVPAPADGIITAVAVKVGDKVKPGQVVLQYEAGAGAETPSKTVKREGSDAPAEQAGRASVPPASAVQPLPAPAPAPAKVPSGPAASEAASLPPRGGIVPASPSVRKFARELGVDLAAVPGSGPGGRVLEQDVKDYVKRVLAGGGGGGGGTGFVQPKLPDFTQWGAVEVFPLKGVRKATAEGMARSWALVPHVTQFDLADVTGTEAARKKFQDTRKGRPGKITMTILAIKAVTKVLAEFPHFASSLDMHSGQIFQKAYRHIGVAVDSPSGLMVPVVRDCDKKSLQELAVEVETLAEKVRSRKISLAEMQGGVFTITNLGGIGGTFFTPIVNWPEVAILGISKTRQELQMVDGKIEVRLVMGLSLSYDHRVIDGADGARFLRRVCEVLGNPFELVN
jgi:pyruvate dehydrogenase E2 component (dihydrolipoamide acetyltransferase)